MMPSGPLMAEHRLILRMIAQIEKELQRIETGESVDVAFIDTAVDFIRSYADRCHHGKEEDILFRDLAQKPLSGEFRQKMEELVQEHRTGRQVVAALVEAREQYARGENRPQALDRIKDCLKQLLPPAYRKRRLRLFRPRPPHLLQPGRMAVHVGRNVPVRPQAVP